MEKKQSTARGFAILSAAGLVCKILSLIYVPFQSLIVGDYGNDIIAFGFRIYFFMFSLSNAGLPSSISKMVSEQDSKGNYRGSRRIFQIATAVLLVLGVVFALLLASGAKWLAGTFRQNESAAMLLTLSPAFIFTSVNCALRGYFQGKRNMVPTAVSNIVEQFFNSLFTVTLIYFFFHFSAKSARYANAAVGSAVGTIIGAVAASAFLIYVYFLTRRQYRRPEHLSTYDGPPLTDRMIARQLALYIVPAVIGSVATSAADLIDQLSCVPRMMASHVITQQLAYQINGQYTTKYQRVMSITTFAATALMTSLIPAIAKACSLENRKTLRHSVLRSFKALYIFMAPCLMGFTIFAKPILAFIFLKTNPGGDQFLALWSWTNILSSIITIQSAVLIGVSRPIAAPVNLIIGMAAKFFFNFFLLPIPAFNMHGAALGTAVSWLITVYLNDRSIRRACGVHIPYLRLGIRPLLCSVGMCASWLVFFLATHALGAVIHKALVVNDLAILLTIAAAAYLYAALIIKANVLSEQEIRELPMGTKLVAVFRKLRLLRAA